MTNKYSFTILLILWLVASAISFLPPNPQAGNGKRRTLGLFRKIEELRKRTVGCPEVAGMTCDPDAEDPCPCSVYAVYYECEKEIKSFNPLVEVNECVRQQ